MNICWFGIYKADLSRNRIYMSGLRNKGVSVVECRDDGGRFAKYVNLYRKHKGLKGKYDVMLVGYPGHVIVPFAKMISSAPVIADLLGSFKDAEEHSHEAGLFRRMKDGIIDFLAVRFADVVLLESEAQKNFFIKKYGNGQAKKFKVLYTGLDESVFYCKGTDKPNPKLVLFRGRLTPESGIFHILETAKMLKDRKDIKFRIIGFHYRLGERVKEKIREDRLDNVELYYDYIPDEDISGKMCEACIFLGQFESSPRLDRTIPHKIFEAMNMGRPVVTAYSPAVGELLKDGESCVFVKRADPEDMKDKIVALLNDPEKRDRLSREAKKVYEDKVALHSLMDKLINIIRETI